MRNKKLSTVPSGGFDDVIDILASFQSKVNCKLDGAKESRMKKSLYMIFENDSGLLFKIEMYLLMHNAK